MKYRYYIRTLSRRILIVFQRLTFFSYNLHESIVSTFIPINYYNFPIIIYNHKVYFAKARGVTEMRRNVRNIILVAVIIFLLIMIVDSLFLESNPIFQSACAPSREFHQNITVAANDFQVLELQFQQGDELELIFSVEVKQQGMVIDVWFVNYANYVRLVDGNEFLFFIDGSAQEISKATKIVSVTQHDAYALVFANYNNVSVEVYLTYDINVYPQGEDTTSDGTDKGEDIPLWKEYYVMLPLGLVIGLIVGLLISRLGGKSKKKAPKVAAKTPSKNVKKRKPKKKLTPAAGSAKKKTVEKPEKKEPVVEKKEEVEEPKEETEVKEKAVTEDVSEKASSTKFCGSCGNAVTTKFCQNCGAEAKSD